MKRSRSFKLSRQFWDDDVLRVNWKITVIVIFCVSFVTRCVPGVQFSYKRLFFGRLHVENQEIKTFSGVGTEAGSL